MALSWHTSPMQIPVDYTDGMSSRDVINVQMQYEMELKRCYEQEFEYRSRLQKDLYMAPSMSASSQDTSQEKKFLYLIEQKTNKPVESIRIIPERNAVRAVFYDGNMAEMDISYLLRSETRSFRDYGNQIQDYGQLLNCMTQPYDEPCVDQSYYPYSKKKNVCASCGEDHGSVKFDLLGRCPRKIEKFWKKVRKVYWYRYTKNKHV